MEDASEIADRLHSVAIHLLRKARREDAGSGLSTACLSALSVIVFGSPLTLGQLAEVEQVRSPTMTRIVDQLVAEGLAERERVLDDRRRTLVRATPAGVRLMREGRWRRVASLARDLAEFSGEELAVLERAADLLERVVGRRHSEPLH